MTLFDEPEQPRFLFAYVLQSERRTLYTRELSEGEAKEKNAHLESLGCDARWRRAETSPAPQKRRVYTIAKA